MRSVIVYDPLGCNMLKHAEILLQHFGCTRLWDIGTARNKVELEPGDLLLTYRMPHQMPWRADLVISFDEAMAEIAEATA